MKKFSVSVQKRAELGGGNIADVRQAEARLATARSSLIQIQGDLRNSQATFLRVIGQPAQDLEPVATAADMPIPADVEQSVARGHAGEPEGPVSRSTTSKSLEVGTR